MFTEKEISEGIYILRLPIPLGTDNTGALIYNEWFNREGEFQKKYNSDSVRSLGASDMSEYVKVSAKGEVKRRGIHISPEVIEILGGADGTAFLMAPWGRPMRCVLGGLLTDHGYSIGPGILDDHYKPTPSAFRVESRRT